MSEFVTPDFLLNHSPDDVHAMMRAILPADIDISEGSHEWNMTRPTALVVARMCEFILPQVIQLILPDYAFGSYLDGQAKTRNLFRRAATAAVGTITITGTPGTIIPTGSLFSTASINDEPSVDYAAVTSATIPESGSVTIDVQCTQTGIIGNTSANTIILVSSKITGITSVQNPEAITGGTEEETDESLQARIAEYDQSQGDSYVGNVSDYRRWATNVPGVGAATVISAQDDSGLVRIILTDANGEPATAELCEKVYNYIMQPDAPDQRRAPIGASVSVGPPEVVQIGVQALVELKPNATLESVKTAYAARLAAYLPEAFEDGEVKYSRVMAALSAVEGVNDFANLRIGVKDGGSVWTTNISISEYQLPVISKDDLMLTSGTV